MDPPILERPAGLLADPEGGVRWMAAEAVGGLMAQGMRNRGGKAPFPCRLRRGKGRGWGPTTGVMR